MVNANTFKQHQIIKALLKMLIEAEKKLDNFCDYLNQNPFLVDFSAEGKEEILCFNDLFELINNSNKEKTEKNWTILGNMITEDVKLDETIEEFLKFNEI